MCLFHIDAAAFRANNSSFWGDVWTQDGDESIKVTNATLGILLFFLKFFISFIFVKIYF